MASGNKNKNKAVRDVVTSIFYRYIVFSELKNFFFAKRRS